MLWLCIHLPDIGPGRIESMAAWAYQYSSIVSIAASAADTTTRTAPLLWLEVGASAALFGNAAQLLSLVKQDLAQTHYRHHCAIAPTPAGAALLARHAADRSPLAATLAALRLHLTPLTLRWLELPPNILTELHASGLRRIGEVLDLPRPAFARRFGSAATLYLQRLVGEAPEPLTAWQPPLHWYERFELERETYDTQTLLFPLQRMLQSFQGYLRARDRAVLRFRIDLGHRQQQTTHIIIGLSTPARDATQFLLLTRERFASLQLQQAVCHIALSSLEFTDPTVVQTDLLGNPQQQLAQLSLLLDRLRARLGEPNVQGIGYCDDHRPERAWRFTTIDANAPARERVFAARATNALPTRPCLLLREPQAIACPVKILAGPERIESGWWDGADVQRDYFIALHESGARQWVFRDLVHNQWYLQGLWS